MRDSFVITITFHARKLVSIFAFPFHENACFAFLDIIRFATTKRKRRFQSNCGTKIWARNRDASYDWKTFNRVNRKLVKYLSDSRCVPQFRARIFFSPRNNTIHRCLNTAVLDSITASYNF